MTNRNILTIAGCVTVLTVSLAIPTLLAKPDENALTRARIEQLEREITENQAEYAKIEPQKARNEGRCSLAKEQEKQLTTLNVSNNSKRRELQFMESLLETDPR